MLTNNKRLLAYLLCMCVTQLATYYCNSKTHTLDHNHEQGHCFKAAPNASVDMLLSGGYQSLVLLGVK